MRVTACKAIAIREPWCTLVRASIKAIEVRSWKTNYRGPLVLVAPATVDAQACRKHGVTPMPGTICCRVDLVDCDPYRLSHGRLACMPYLPPWRREELYAWRFENAHPLVRADFRGARLGFFSIPSRYIKRAR